MNKKQIIILVIACVVLAVAVFFFIKKKRQRKLEETIAPPPLSMAAQMLVNPPAGNDRILPHMVDNKTYFKDSITFLVKGGYKPKVQDDGSSEGEQPLDLSDQARLARTRGGITKTKDENAMKHGKTLSLTDVIPDWTGVVLSPTATTVSQAYNDAVTIPRIEAHPLRDDRIRVWTRIKNKMEDDINVEVACFFQYQGEKDPPRPVFTPIDIPFAKSRDISFVSESSGVESYTILVK